MGMLQPEWRLTYRVKDSIARSPLVLSCAPAEAAERPACGDANQQVSDDDRCEQLWRTAKEGDDTGREHLHAHASR